MRKPLYVLTLLTLLLFLSLGCQSQPENSSSPLPPNQPAAPAPVPSYVPPTPLNIDTWNLDYATIKYDSNGNELWVSRYNGSGYNIDDARTLVVDDAGNVYVTGGSRSDRGNGVREDYATVKYDNNGNQLWVIRYGGPGDGDNTANAIAVDGEGNVYVTGRSTGSNGEIPLRCPHIYVDEKPAENKGSVQYTTFWPADYRARVDNGVFEILDGAGNVVLRDGEEVKIEGNVIYSAGSGTAGQLLVELPGGCFGPYLVVDKILR